MSKQSHCVAVVTPAHDVQVSKQSQKHAAQLESFQYAVGSRRPAKPHCSKELLNQRRVVDLLAKQGCYSKAAAVQQATNGMEAAEMRATLATFEAEVSEDSHHVCADTLDIAFQMAQCFLLTRYIAYDNEDNNNHYNTDGNDDNHHDGDSSIRIIPVWLMPCGVPVGSQNAHNALSSICMHALCTNLYD